MADGLLGPLPPKGGGLIGKLPPKTGGGLLGALPPKQETPAAPAAPSVTLPPWIEGDTTPAYALSSQDRLRMQATADDINASRERREKVGQYVQQIRDGGGVPLPVQAALSNLQAFQVDPAAVVEAASRESTTGKILGGARALVSAIPGVPNPEVSEESRLKAQAMQMIAAEEAAKSDAAAFTQGVGGALGTIGSLYAGGTAIKGAGAGIRALRGIKEAEKVSKLGRLGRSAAGLGGYMATPALESAIYDDYEPGQRIQVLGEAAKQFGKGAALGAALGGATKLGEVIPKVSPFIGRPLAQTAATSAYRVLDEGRLPTGREARVDLALNALTQGVPNQALPEFLRRSERTPDAEAPLSSRLVSPTEEFRAANPESAYGSVDKTTGSVLSKDKALPPAPHEVTTTTEPVVGEIPRKLRPHHPKADPALGATWSTERVEVIPEYKTEVTTAPVMGEIPGRLRKHREIDPITGSEFGRERLPPLPPEQVVTTTGPVRGETQRTRSPRHQPYEGAIGTSLSTDDPVVTNPAFQAMMEGKRPFYMDPRDESIPTPMEVETRKQPMVGGVEIARTDRGVYHYRPEVARAWIAKNPKFSGLVARSGSDIDFQKTIENFERADRLGAILDYGEGNFSKQGARHVVTGLDAEGREISSIAAKNTKSAEQALRRQGASSVEVRPIEGAAEVIAKRITDQQKKRSRESGMIDLSMLTKKRPQTMAERQAAEEKDVYESERNRWYPQYHRQAEGSPDVYEAGVKAIADPNATIRKASTYAEDIWRALGNDPKMVDLWHRYIIHQNAAAMRAQGRDPGKHLFMPHEDWLTVRANRGLFDEARRVSTEFSESMGQYTEDAGIGASRRTPEDVPYWRLPRLVSADQRIATGERAKRAGLPTGYLMSEDALASPATGGQGIGRVMRFASRKSGSSKMASGQSDFYAVEPYTMAAEMLRAHQSPANHNRFKETVRKHAMTEEAARDQDFKADYLGEKVELVKVPIDRRPEWMKAPQGETADAATPGKTEPEVYVPKPIADMWMDYVQSTPAQPETTLGKVLNMPTKLSLALTGADSAVYVMAGLDAASRIPGYGRSAYEKAAVKFGGIGKFLGAIRDIEDSASPKYQAMEKLLAESGSLRVSEEGPQSPSNAWTEPEYWLRRIPFTRPLHKLTTSVFGRGGKADRQRISLGLALREADPSLTDAQVVWAVQNLGGSFTRGLQPGAVQAFQGGTLRKTIAPFVNFGTTKLRSALDQARGQLPTAPVQHEAGAKRYSVGQASKIPYTIGTAALLAYVIGDDQSLIETLSHPGSVRIAGKDYPIIKFLAPYSSAAMRATGAQNLITSLAQGDTANQTATNVLRAPLNYAAGYAGPVPAAAFAATTGRIPYFGSDGEPMPATPPSEFPIRDRALSAASRLIPGIEDQVLATTRTEPMSPERRTLETLLGVLGVEGKQPYSMERAHNAAYRSSEYQYRDVVSSVANAASKIKDPKSRLDYIRSQLSRFQEENRSRAMGDVLDRISGKEKSVKEGAALYEAGR